MAARPRTPDDVRGEIERERDELVRAVENLRVEATSFQAKVLRIAAVVAIAVIVLKLIRRRAARRRNAD